VRKNCVVEQNSTKTILEVKMNIKFPFEVLKWVDDNRGSRSRKAFIVDCLMMLVLESKKM